MQPAQGPQAADLAAQAMMQPVTVKFRLLKPERQQRQVLSATSSTWALLSLAWNHMQTWHS